MPLKNSQFRGYNFQQIAKSALAPYGLDLKIVNPPKGWDKAFKDVNVIPGDSVFSFLERLARQRGLFLFDDKNGDLNAGRLSGDDSGAELQEGRNILAANCIIQDSALMAKNRYDIVGQQRGDDATGGDTARKPAAFIENKDAPRYGYKLFIAEEPGDAEDMKQRADHEMNKWLGDIIEAQVTVQGWRNTAGALWSETLGKQVHIVSPMLLLDHDLFVQSVSMMQDPGGTRTVLGLRRQLLGPLDRSNVDPQGGVLPPTVPEAKPEA